MTTNTLTKDDIINLKPGPELNAVVIREIMHHVWNEGERPRCIYCAVWKGWPPNLAGCEAKPYSLYMDYAWNIVERVGGAWDIKKRYRPHPDDPYGSGGRATYQAILQTSDYDPEEDLLYNTHSVKSPWCRTAAEAICKAALLAKIEGHDAT